MIDLEEEQKSIDTLENELLCNQRQLAMESEALKEATEQLCRAQDAQEIIQLLAQAIQQQAHERISAIVSSCLSTVFDDPYEFKIAFERKRGKTEANLRFIRRGLDVDPITSSGGGMIDVAAFALRVACLVLHQPKLSRVVMLDEPFRFVSAQYRDNVRMMLEGLSKDMGIQIIMVTHIKELETGKVVEL
jgi:DNA repair exonuclease SbcCD ATPase subunit